jgi:chromate transporter
MIDELEAAGARPQPALWDVFVTMLLVGLQSFGGGSSTFLLLHRACVTQGWLSEAEFVRAWALVQIAPGINLVKLTGLIGYDLRGWPGLVAAMAGLLVPSAGTTVLMTAGFAAIRRQPLVQAALNGILPATLGLSVAMAVEMALPVLRRARHEGRPRLAAHLAVVTGSALALAAAGASPVVVLMAAGLVTAAALAAIPPRPVPPPAQEGP